MRSGTAEHLYRVRFHKFNLWLMYHRGLYISWEAWAFIYYRLTRDEMKKLDKLAAQVKTT